LVQKKIILFEKNPGIPWHFLFGGVFVSTLRKRKKKNRSIFQIVAKILKTIKVMVPKKTPGFGP